MQTVKATYERCCGLDVHKDRVVACLCVPDGGGGRRAEVRTFGTTTRELLALSDWLVENGCTHVAMESTGVYWRPVFNILEEVATVLLVNARDLKILPGRKSDVMDCEFIAEMLEHGLLRSSFIPPAPIRDLRDLTRYRKTLIRGRVDEVNRLQKILQMANIKLSSVVTDVMGASGRAMLTALASGERDAEVLADLAKGSLRNKRSLLIEALAGRFRDHHAFMVREILDHIRQIDRHIEKCSRRIERSMRPFTKEQALIRTIPGIGQMGSEVVIAECGVDMTRFPSAAHLASWVGLCPGNNESAGKRRSGRTRHGDPWLKTGLVEAAWVAVRMRKGYAGALFRRIARRRGPKKAILAVAHHLIVSVWHVLTRQEPYRDLGSDHFDRLDTDRLKRHHIRRLEQLGYTVEVLPAA